MVAIKSRCSVFSMNAWYCAILACSSAAERAAEREREDVSPEDEELLRPAMMENGPERRCQRREGAAEKMRAARCAGAAREATQRGGERECGANRGDSSTSLVVRHEAGASKESAMSGGRQAARAVRMRACGVQLRRSNKPHFERSSTAARLTVVEAVRECEEGERAAEAEGKKKQADGARRGQTAVRRFTKTFVGRFDLAIDELGCSKKD